MSQKSDNKKNSVRLSLRNDSGVEGEVDKQAFEEKVAKGAVAEEIVSPAIVASIVDHPITFKYGDESVRISGRGREKFADHSKLPKVLPVGLVSKKL